jgi:hypothetical protein
MAWGWSASLGFAVGLPTALLTTSCQRCRPVGNIMVLSPGGKVPYGTQ